jgi:hypothetical protein
MSGPFCCYAADLSSLSAPRATIFRAPSGTAAAAPSLHPTVRASTRRALRPNYGESALNVARERFTAFCVLCARSPQFEF